MTVSEGEGDLGQLRIASDREEHTWAVAISDSGNIVETTKNSVEMLLRLALLSLRDEMGNDPGKLRCEGCRLVMWLSLLDEYNLCPGCRNEQ